MRVTYLNRRRLAVAAASLAAAFSTIGAAASAENVIAIVGVSVVPMTDSRRIVPDQTVLVRNGRIAAVGRRGSVKIPAGAQHIAGAGRFLMPGLADMHVHLEYIEDSNILKQFVAHGVTTVRSMDGRPYILDWRRRVAAGQLIGPAIVTAGPIIDGSPPLRDDNLAVADAAAATAAINAQAEAGYDFAKLYTNLSPEAYRAAVAAARKRGMAVSGHVPRKIKLAEALASQRSIEHLTDYGDAVETRDGAEAQRWHWSKLYLAQPLDPNKMALLASQLARAGTWTVPTLVEADRRLGTASEIQSWNSEREMASIPAGGRKQWLAQVQRSASRLGNDDWQIVDRGRRNRLTLVRALHAGGARLLAGTDTPNPFVVPGAALHQELAMMVAAGLSPGEALLTATRDPARYLGQEQMWGTVEPGRRADLILLEANPLTDIANTRRQVGVMLSGRWFERPELDVMAMALTEPPAR